MSAIKATRTVSIIKGLVAGAALAGGLAISTGQLTAAGLGEPKLGSQSLDSVIIDQPASSSQAFGLADKPEVFTRAGTARAAFGFPTGASRNGRHVHDGIQGTDYDEVSEVDSSGKPVSVTQFGSNGKLVTAVRFDAQPAADSVAVGADAATKAAQKAVSGAGISVTGSPRTRAGSGSDGWDVSWSRTQGAYAVRGDETRVHVWRNGAIQSVAQVEHRLATQPAALLLQTDANKVVNRQCTSWLVAGGSGFKVQAMQLEWVGPNAAFDPSKLSAAAAPYRLAWVADVKPSGPASESVQLITLYVDAGTGAIIGGDVVE